jgi:cell division protease FtsH
VPHGIGALGYTLQRPSEDRHVLRRSELLVKMSVLLGGRAAEHLVFGEPSTGAADDLARATDMARDMVQRYGMDKKLGPVAYAERAPAFLVNDGAASLRSEYTSPETAERIDEAVRQLLQEALQRSREVLHENREILDRAAEALMAQETLDEPELRRLADGLKRVGRVE